MNESGTSGNFMPTRRDVLRAGAAGVVTLVGFGAGLRGRAWAEQEQLTGQGAGRALTQSTPALEEGPFWIEEADHRYRRSDLRANLDGTNQQAGLPLNLWLTVSELKNGTVQPMPNAFVYIWIANAMGVYSGEPQENTASDSYLRGYQVTDGNGVAAFVANYPGWYGGRTVHVHARVRTYPGNDPSQKPLTDFETQLFFDDAVTDHVMANIAPYNTRRPRDTTNKIDRVYNGPALDHAPGAPAASSPTTPTGNLTKVKLVGTATHANASFHMVLDPSKRTRPPMPPGGFGSPPPATFGGPPPMNSDGSMPPPPDGFGGADGPPPGS